MDTRERQQVLETMFFGMVWAVVLFAGYQMYRSATAVTEPRPLPPPLYSVSNN